MNNLAASELILNQDGSIYHLNLLPEQVAQNIILVGDQDRVEKVTRYFDTVDHKVKKREFHTQTGTYNGKKISVISTGIGTDNIDIVLNELDALVNIDFTSRRIKEEKKALNIIRIGTSGSIQKEIPVDSILISTLVAGFDSLLHYYQSDRIQVPEINEALNKHLKIHSGHSKPYVVECSSELFERFKSSNVFEGFTGSNVGFYAPQGRALRLPLRDKDLNEKIATFNFKGKKITNLEMETSGIYGLAKLLGHKAISVNAIVANRVTGNFSENGDRLIDKVIKYSLEKLEAI